MENAEKTKKMRLDTVNRGIEGIQNNSVWLASILIKFLAQGPVSFRIEAQILQYAYDHHIQRLDVGEIFTHVFMRPTALRSKFF
jgi:hypothetical protein